MILQKGIDDNWAAAIEHNPEAFARVVSITNVNKQLYIELIRFFHHMIFR